MPCSPFCCGTGGGGNGIGAVAVVAWLVMSMGSVSCMIRPTDWQNNTSLTTAAEPRRQSVNEGCWCWMDGVLIDG